ncbi:hypothetical protein BpHYR1_039978 [Brachionus plicatilis]|uniref:Uncharacterized protein n=1 Tax=Brachionus plicatilis TaxID=10195 RepID=A0A3M7SIF0_BRAPC|nr:hypothetical protein BpHYR1_039978 [Brachionus plicatilis]
MSKKIWFVPKFQMKCKYVFPFVLCENDYIDDKYCTKRRIEQYLVKYITKSEPTFKGKEMKFESNEVKNYFDIRIVSSVVAAELVFGHHFVQSNMKVTFIPTSLPGDEFKFLKKREELIEMDLSLKSKSNLTRTYKEECNIRNLIKRQDDCHPGIDYSTYSNLKDQINILDLKKTKDDFEIGSLLKLDQNLSKKITDLNDQYDELTFCQKKIVDEIQQLDSQHVSMLNDKTLARINVVLQVANRSSECLRQIYQ